MQNATPDDPWSSEAIEDAVAADPRDGRWRYLRGADHASGGRYDEAIADFEAALVLDPGLHAARFQAGLLHLTLGQAAEAQAMLQPLDTLSPHDPLRIFGFGLRALIADDLPRCIACLEEGIRLNVALPPLNRDMALLLERVRAAVTAAPTAAHGDPTGAAPAPAGTATPSSTPAPSRPVEVARPRDLSLYDAGRDG